MSQAQAGPAKKAKAKPRQKPKAPSKGKAAKKKSAGRMTAAKLRQTALRYHMKPRPGKVEVIPTKPVRDARDLSLAYSPGVAAPCLEIQKDAQNAYRYTSKGNLVGIITNGSAVLGLGNIGPLAAKPVMEGKAMLFKIFAGIDVFDLELNISSPEKFIDTVMCLSDSFGAINLEDIAAPICFQIEERLREQLQIPVLHDDQTGTAVVACAALRNAMEIQDKRPSDIKLVCIGAGAAGIGILKLAREYFGLALEQIHLVDSKGLVTVDQVEMSTYKLPYAKPATNDTSLKEALRGADIVIGVSAKGIVNADMVASLAGRPIILAMANPDPEVTPELVHSVRADAIVATGRSDYPNQVNNSICFPYLFRGALDARAKRFTHAMFNAAVTAISDMARQPVQPSLRKMYPGENLKFGPDYILPKQNDKRLLKMIAPAITKAYREADIPAPAEVPVA